LNASNTFLGACYLEVHVTQVVFDSLNKNGEGRFYTLGVVEVAGIHALFEVYTVLITKEKFEPGSVGIIHHSSKFGKHENSRHRDNPGIYSTDRKHNMQKTYSKLINLNRGFKAQTPTGLLLVIGRFG